ncbi:MAG: acyl-CoA dehydrogenase [Sphingomonadales bacterium]
MDVTISEDQAKLADTVRDYLTGVHGPAQLRLLDAEPDKRSDDVWRGLVEMGLTALLVPEAQGGLGLSLLDGVLIATELGRAAVAEPVVDTALIAVPLLAQAGGHEHLLEEIAAGTSKVALQHPVNPWVADLDAAHHLLSARDDALLLRKRQGTIEMLESVDPLRRLFACVAPAGEVVGSADALLSHAALMTAAQLVGVAEAMLAISTDYAGTRTQFGQPIGSFQAIKHHLASAAVKIAFARPVLHRAAVALDTGDVHAAIHISHAKLAASDAAWSMSETAIQVHGAMGYTYEVDLHFWMKRAWALSGAWGDRSFHFGRVDAAIIGGTMPIGPGHTFG